MVKGASEEGVIVSFRSAVGIYIHSEVTKDGGYFRDVESINTIIISSSDNKAMVTPSKKESLSPPSITPYQRLPTQKTELPIE